jgi:hypothetical protein
VKWRRPIVSETITLASAKVPLARFQVNAPAIAGSSGAGALSPQTEENFCLTLQYEVSCGFDGPQSCQAGSDTSCNC